jgi:hypothetical protein
MKIVIFLILSLMMTSCTQKNSAAPISVIPSFLSDKSMPASREHPPLPTCESCHEYKNWRPPEWRFKWRVQDKNRYVELAKI